MPANTAGTGNITVCYDNVASFVQMFARPDACGAGPVGAQPDPQR